MAAASPPRDIPVWPRVIATIYQPPVNKYVPPAKRNGQVYQRKCIPWTTGDSKGSAFIAFFHVSEDGRKWLYVCKNKDGTYGLPGGKAESSDISGFITAKRECKEETGFQIPSIRQDPRWYFKVYQRDQHDNHGDISCELMFFGIRLMRDMMKQLPVGPTPEVERVIGGEQETMWIDISEYMLPQNFRKFQNRGVGRLAHDLHVW